MERNNDNFQEIEGDLINKIRLLEDKLRGKKIKLAKIVAKNFLKKFTGEISNVGYALLTAKIKDDENFEYSEKGLNCLEYLVFLGFLNKNSPKLNFHEFLIQIPQKNPIKKISQEEISNIITKINKATCSILVIGAYKELSSSGETEPQKDTLIIRGCYKFR